MFRDNSPVKKSLGLLALLLSACGPGPESLDTSEVADAAIFLLSDAGRAVTAEVLMVDGGYHATGM